MESVIESIMHHHGLEVSLAIKKTEDALYFQYFFTSRQLCNHKEVDQSLEVNSQPEIKLKGATLEVTQHSN